MRPHWLEILSETLIETCLKHVKQLLITCHKHIWPVFVVCEMLLTPVPLVFAVIPLCHLVPPPTESFRPKAVFLAFSSLNFFTWGIDWVREEWVGRAMVSNSHLHTHTHYKGSNLKLVTTSVHRFASLLIWLEKYTLGRNRDDFSFYSFSLKIHRGKSITWHYLNQSNHYPLTTRMRTLVTFTYYQWFINETRKHYILTLWYKECSNL